MERMSLGLGELLEKILQKEFWLLRLLSSINYGLTCSIQNCYIKGNIPNCSVAESM
jgi:hypothetical protein